MTTPRKAEIYQKALELYVEHCYRTRTPELANITPARNELVESGYISQAQSELMKSDGNLYAYELEAQRKTYLEHMYKPNMGKLPIDLSECKRSNILISGTNQQGKSLCAMSIADVLMRNQWQIITFDTCGNWKSKSSIPIVLKVRDKNMSVNFSKSMICDLSLLKLKNQKGFIEKFLERLWLLRVVTRNDKWILCVFEEFQLMAKNLRGELSQNLLRIMSVGANWKIRCLGITPDLSLIDPAFIRLCQQRYHFRLGNEPNAKRRFRAYYGLDWTRITKSLDVGYCLYVLRDKVAIHKIPMFQRKQIEVEM